MGVAPVGYVNRITESGRKYIAIDEAQANLLRQAFEEMATGIYTMEDVRKRAVRKGLRCPETTFRRALENLVYCGKIELKAYRDEKAELIEGKRKRQPPNVKELSNAVFELRGFLKCPKCGKVLTASTSKGRNARYSYYHCLASCGVRFSAPMANEAFIQSFQKFKPNKATEKLFRELVIEEFSGIIKIRVICVPSP